MRNSNSITEKISCNVIFLRFQDFQMYVLSLGAQTQVLEIMDKAFNSMELEEFRWVERIVIKGKLHSPERSGNVMEGSTLQLCYKFYSAYGMHAFLGRTSLLLSSHGPSNLKQTTIGTRLTLNPT